MRNLRLACRTLAATPIVTLVAIISLALGIGANTAIFSLVSSLLLRSLPVFAADRLALLSGNTGATTRAQYSYATFEQIRRQTDLFDGALAYTDCCGVAILNLGGENVATDRQFVSGDFFDTLGIHAIRGRLLTRADNELAAPDGPVTVVSYRLWREQLGGREDAIGSRLRINGRPVSVVGVMPPAFFGVEVGRRLDVALPSRWAAQFTSTPFDDDTVWLNIVVRLKRGLSLQSARAGLRAAQPQIRVAAMPARSASEGFLSEPLTLESAGLGFSALRQRFEQPLWAIFAVVAFVLLIASANIGHLLMARGIARRHELSVRVALGASRGQLVRQLLAESALLSIGGAALGLCVAPTATRLIVARLSTAPAPIALDTNLDWRVLAFTIAITAVTTILFGVAPAWRASRVAPIDALKASPRGAGGNSAAFSGALLVVQVALSLLLVVAAGLLLQTFRQLSGVPLGFKRDQAIVVKVNAPTVAATERGQLFGRLAQASAKIPGVIASGGSMNPPIVGELQGDLVISAPGTAAPPNAERITQMNLITPGWMAAYGTAIQAGREFNDRDVIAAPAVMIVNDEFVRRLIPGRDAIGKTLALAARVPPNDDLPFGLKTIVGVVHDTVARSVRDPTTPAVYLPLSQWRWPVLQYTFYIGVRSTSVPALLSRAISEELRRVNGNLTVTTEPLARQVDESLAADRVLAILLGTFGAVALLLAGLGLYGVTSSAVEHRRGEMGIRIALGATPAEIARLAVSRVAWCVGLGVMVGAVLSLWASPLAAALLYGLSPRDPRTLAISALALTATGAVAAWLPAWRATRIDPATLLRER